MGFPGDSSGLSKGKDKMELEKHKTDRDAEADEHYDDADGQGEPNEENAQDNPNPDAEPQDQGHEEPQGEEMAPEGHEEWLRHLEHASKTHPLVYGLVKDYADRMAAGQQPGAEGEPPPEEAPPEDVPPGEEASAEGAEGGEPAMTPEEEEAQRALSGGHEEMPEPTGDEQPGAVPMQDNQMPVEYAEYLQAVVSEIGSLKAELQKIKAERVRDQKDLAKLSKTAAEKETELLVYQLGKAGVKKVATKEGRKQVYDHLLGLDSASRHAKYAEIVTNYAKDEAVSYADANAPVGEFLPVSDESANTKKPVFDDAKLDIALKYMRATNKPWAECQAYAENSTVVNS